MQCLTETYFFVETPKTEEEIFQKFLCLSKTKFWPKENIQAKHHSFCRNGELSAKRYLFCQKQAYFGTASFAAKRSYVQLCNVHHANFTHEVIMARIWKQNISIQGGPSGGTLPLADNKTKVMSQYIFLKQKGNFELDVNKSSCTT